jgi:hypothetical protein
MQTTRARKSAGSSQSPAAATAASRRSTTIKVFGDVSRFDAVTRDGTLAGGFLARYAHEGRLVGALTVGQSGELETLLQELIEARAPTEAFDAQPADTDASARAPATRTAADSVLMS